MKNQSLANYYQFLQELSDTYTPEARKPKDNVSSLSGSSTSENYNDNLYYQKSFFVWSKEEFNKKNFITYFYAPSNIYYECSLDSNRAQKEASDFLKCKNIDIEQGHNILEDIEGCKELDSPDHDSDHRDSDLDIDIKIIELSKPY